MNPIITYETLYEILRREKSRQEIQPLDPEFFKKVLTYLEEKQKILESQKSKDSIFSTETAKTEKQLDNIKRILKEIYERRENKIIQMALFASKLDKIEDLSSLLKEEQEIYRNINTTLTDFRKSILINLVSLKQPIIPQPKDIKIGEKKDQNRLVRFTHSIPKFVGSDLETYGPFEEEDLGNLPADIAKLLIAQNRAEEIK